MDEKILREQLRRALSWHDAHAGWKSAVKDFPVKLRGKRPSGAPHSPWELLEHMRLAQKDILEFCRDPKHVSPSWPESYWPKDPAPPTAGAWDKSVQEFEKDVRAVQKLLDDPKTDLFAPIAHGKGQTILREVLVIADHNSYHLGQFVLVRRLLGAWIAS